jgi:hypothetical protein
MPCPNNFNENLFKVALNAWHDSGKAAYVKQAQVSRLHFAANWGFGVISRIVIHSHAFGGENRNQI